MSVSSPVAPVGCDRGIFMSTAMTQHEKEAFLAAVHVGCGADLPRGFFLCGFSYSRWAARLVAAKRSLSIAAARWRAAAAASGPAASGEPLLKGGAGSYSRAS